MKILITGNLGFIGSHLADALDRQKYHLYGIDNLSSNAIERLESSALTYHRLDDIVRLLFPLPTAKIFSLIIHCASPVGPALIKSGRSTAYEIVKGAHDIIELAADCNAKLILFSSSEAADIKLADFPNDCRSEYALGKATMECMAFASEYPNIQIIRPYNIVGPRQQARGGYVLPRFIDQIKLGQPLTIFSSGSQRRIFTSVHDLVDFVLLLIDKWPQEKKIFNIANPANVASIRQLADEVLITAEGWDDYSTKITEQGARELLNNPTYRDGFERYEVDVSEATALGWQPKWTLTDIIKEMLQ